MSKFNKEICSQKQYDLLKKIWFEGGVEIKNFREILFINNEFVEREKIRASEASMILKCVLK